MAFVFSNIFSIETQDLKGNGCIVLSNQPQNLNPPGFPMGILTMGYSPQSLFHAVTCYYVFYPLGQRTLANIVWVEDPVTMHFPKQLLMSPPYPRLSPQSRFASAQQELLQTLEHFPFSTLSLRNTSIMLTQ